ncbi:MAG: autotransporter domain-containing protein, partial [Vulcanococcus sp.]
MEITSDKTIYKIDVTECFADGEFCKGAKSFQTNTWYGNAQLARDLAAAATDKLGLPNLQRQPPNEGPYFIYKSGSPSVYNATSLPWDGYGWVGSPLDYINIYASGAWNSFTGVTTSNIRRVYLAVETSAPRPVPVAGPILPGNNGTSINTTASLASGGLLPQFQGGTLAVSASNASVAADFTLDGSSRNAIDLAGNSATFSGIFTDQAANIGRITFKNSGSPATIILTGQSRYKGLTGVFSGVTLKIGADNALPAATEVLLDRGANLLLDGFNQSVSAITGSGTIDLGRNTLTLNGSSNGATQILSSAAISGTGSLVKKGTFTQYLTGSLTYTGQTTVDAGTLVINGTSQSTTTTVEPGGILGGTGTITGDVFNSGKVAPGAVNQLGTLTVNGNYGQLSPGVLEIQVDGSASDRLALQGSNRFILLGGELNITSLPGTAITAGKTYTAITTPAGTQGGEFGLNTTFGVVGASGYTFVRETDPRFSQLDGGKAQACDPKNPELCTDLRFGWLQATPTSTPTTPTTVTTVPTAVTPGVQTINTIKQTGGAITTAITGNIQTNTDVCAANTGNSDSCNKVNQPGTGAGASNHNNIAVAKAIDAGSTSVQAAVTTGVSGGQPILTPSGTPTGYTTNQTKAGLVTPDFVNVAAALFAVPTRSQLNAALHQVTAEPYASMQSVALEAMEQFRTNALALGDGERGLRFWREAELCEQPDGTLIKPDATNHTADCKLRKVPQATRWSLLIDASNTQASLDGTNDLASLDYNVFQSTYGLQYDASPQWSIGGAFGYGQANLYNYEYANTRIDSDTYGGGLWAIYRPGDAWKITGLLGYMNLQYDSSRQIDFGGLNRTARANWSGNGFTTALEVQYDWILSANKADRNA